MNKVSNVMKFFRNFQKYKKNQKVSRYKSLFELFKETWNATSR